LSKQCEEMKKFTVGVKHFCGMDYVKEITNATRRGGGSAKTTSEILLDLYIFYVEACQPLYMRRLSLLKHALKVNNDDTVTCYLSARTKQRAQGYDKACCQIMKNINDLETSGLLFEDFASKVASGEFDTDSITAFRVHVHKEMQHLKVMKKVEMEDADIDGSYCAAVGVVSPLTVINATPKRTAKNKATSNVDEDIAIGAHSEDHLLRAKIPRKSGAAPQTDGQTSDLTNMQVNPEDPPSVIRKTVPPAFPNAGDASNVAAGETNASQSNYVIKFVSTDITDRDDIPTQKKSRQSNCVAENIGCVGGQFNPGHDKGKDVDETGNPFPTC
jgi:hypothetical protein